MFSGVNKCILKVTYLDLNIECLLFSTTLYIPWCSAITLKRFIPGELICLRNIVFSKLFCRLFFNEIFVDPWKITFRLIFEWGSSFRAKAMWITEDSKTVSMNYEYEFLDGMMIFVGRPFFSFNEISLMENGVKERNSFIDLHDNRSFFAVKGREDFERNNLSC